jgi:uncharacterized RDD family membrane protein YckC
MGWSGPAPDPLTAPALFESIVNKRIFAYVIDFVLVSFVAGVMWVFAAIIGIVTLGLGFGLIAALIPLFPFVYDTITIGALGGGTLGMRIMGIHVRSLSGTTPSMIQALIMSVLCFLSFAFPLVLLFPLFHPQRRALHDIAARTIVINKVR